MSDDDWYYDPKPWGFGQIHANDAFGEPIDVVKELHKIVSEVTGKPVEPKKRIGFLPW